MTHAVLHVNNGGWEGMGLAAKVGETLAQSLSWRNSPKGATDGAPVVRSCGAGPGPAHHTDLWQPKGCCESFLRPEQAASTGGMGPAGLWDRAPPRVWVPDALPGDSIPSVWALEQQMYPPGLICWHIFFKRALFGRPRMVQKTAPGAVRVGSQRPACLLTCGDR